MSGQVTVDFTSFDFTTDPDTFHVLPPIFTTLYDHLSKNREKVIQEVALDTLSQFQQFVKGFKLNQKIGCSGKMFTFITRFFHGRNESAIDKIENSLVSVIREKKSKAEQKEQPLLSSDEAKLKISRETQQED